MKNPLLVIMFLLFSRVASAEEARARLLVVDADVELCGAECSFCDIAANHSFAEESSKSNSEFHVLDSIIAVKEYQPIPVDSDYIRKNENHRYIVVQPNADSNFGEIDSLISNVNYDAILSELSESVIKCFEKDAIKYKNDVVGNYKYFDVSISEGDSILDVNASGFLRFEYDYAINIYADDMPRQHDYIIPFPTRWNYVLEKENRIYLFSKLIRKEFHATDAMIKLPYDPNLDYKIYLDRNSTSWTFPIKDGRIAGAFLSFNFGDGVVNPTIDLLNYTYVFPEYYLKKDHYEYLKSQNNLGIKSSGIERIIRIDRNHVATAQGLQALAEQRVPEGKVFVSVEQMPQFPGGEAELLKYVSDHLVYPEEAKKKGIKGRVVIQFVVLADGAIGEVKVARGKSAELDKAAVEVVKNLPKFKPGLLNDRPVAVWYTLPVIFKLPQE